MARLAAVVRAAEDVAVAEGLEQLAAGWTPAEVAAALEGHAEHIHAIRHGGDTLAPAAGDVDQLSAAVHAAAAAEGLLPRGAQS